MNQKPVLTSLLLAVFIGMGFAHSNAWSQTPADRFFKQIFAQNAASWYPVSDENSGKYKESYGNGLTTRQSFLLVDAYAAGKARYLISLETVGMDEYLPGVNFFKGELSANLEYNAGKLPFVGFSDADGAGMVLPGSYDVFSDQFMLLMGRPSLKKQGQKAKFAEEVAKLLALVRLKQVDCNEDILEFGKAHTKWNGNILNLRMGYDLKCKVDDTNEWGPKTKYLQFDFEFSGDKLGGITPLEWP